MKANVAPDPGGSEETDPVASSFWQPVLLMGRANFAAGDAMHFDPADRAAIMLRPVYPSDVPPAWTYPPRVPGSDAVPADVWMLVLLFARGIRLRFVLSLPEELRDGGWGRASKAQDLAFERAPALRMLVQVCRHAAFFRTSSVFD